MQCQGILLKLVAFPTCRWHRYVWLCWGCRNEYQRCL